MKKKINLSRAKLARALFGKKWPVTTEFFTRALESIEGPFYRVNYTSPPAAMLGIMETMEQVGRETSLRDLMRAERDVIALAIGYVDGCGSKWRLRRAIEELKRVSCAHETNGRA